MDPTGGGGDGTEEVDRPVRDGPVGDAAAVTPSTDRSLLLAGEKVLLVDAKQRRYLVTLRPDAGFHTHVGIVAHNDLIGAYEGSTIFGSTGRRFLVVRPTLSDMVLKMPRGAQVIYPKDLAAILMEADIAPGMRVLEAGVGSGALSMALLRAGASVVGYELREDFANRAHNNVEAMVGGDADYRVELRDVYEGIEERGLDRIVLDLPEPWRVVPHAEVSLRSGGILCAYLPTINQTAQFRGALEDSAFGLPGTLEVLHRTWHIEDRSVRPDHRMVGHTGFLTTARLLRPEDRGSRPGGPIGWVPPVSATMDAGGDRTGPHPAGPDDGDRATDGDGNGTDGNGTDGNGTDGNGTDGTDRTADGDR